MRAGASFLVWLMLVLLVGAQLLASRAPATAAFTPLIGLMMAALVALTYMRLGRMRGLPAIFALAGVFWLLVMMGLGSLDPLTRHDIGVPATTTN